MPTISANGSHSPETQDLSVRNIDGQPTANTIMLKMLDQLHGIAASLEAR